MLQQQLFTIERELSQLAPKFNKSRQTLNNVMATRDRIRSSLASLEQRDDLIAKRDELNKLKKTSKADYPKLDISSSAVHDFCQVVSHVLTEWQFPGKCHVSFDKETYDLRIDGKLRIDNGKGVRAVTHAAFKVALLLFCQERGLPHPGFIVLDTPLLTYRDPMKNPKFGELSEDEKLLAQSSVKHCFFKHLSSMSHFGQFIIIENIDPPAGINELAHVHVFYGNAGGGRNGFFPV